MGIAIHNGSTGNFQRTDKIAFGSRVLFEPELGVGVQVNDRLSVEASWVHMSHAQLFGRQNPGIDNVGVRLNLRLLRAAAKGSASAAPARRDQAERPNRRSILQLHVQASCDPSRSCRHTSPERW